MTAVRLFVRFLVVRGVLRSSLEGAAPTIRQWQHASLPKALTREEVQRVLSLFESETDVAVRDRAVLLLLARMGLRSAEVAALQIEHLRWSAGETGTGGGATVGTSSALGEVSVPSLLQDLNRGDLFRPSDESFTYRRDEMCPEKRKDWSTPSGLEPVPCRAQPVCAQRLSR